MLSVRTFHRNCSGMEAGTGEFCASDFTRIYDRKELEQLQNQRINDIVQIADMAVNKPCATVKIRGSWLENSRLLLFRWTGDMKKRILVVDDEISIRMGIREFAEYQGYDVTGAANGREALELCRQQDFDLIIMDIMMPEMDGYEAYRRIREIKDIPALMLSAKGEEYDKLQGFEAGIDDYVVKPFSIKELMARVNVILMRHEPREEKPQGEIYEFQGLTVNISAREVFVDGVHVELRPKEYDLLFFLVRNRGIVFSRDALLEKVWGFDFMGDDRTVDAQIKMLRHVLGDYRTYIVTYRGAVYKFEAEEKA